MKIERDLSLNLYNYVYGFYGCKNNFFMATQR